MQVGMIPKNFFLYVFQKRSPYAGGDDSHGHFVIKLKKGVVPT